MVEFTSPELEKVVLRNEDMQGSKGGLSSARQSLGLRAIGECLRSLSTIGSALSFAVFMGQAFCLAVAILGL